MAGVNFPFFLFFAFGSVFQIITSLVQFQQFSMAVIKTFMCGDLSLL